MPKYDYPVTEPFEITEREKRLLTIMAYAVAEDLCYPYEDGYITEEDKEHEFKRRIGRKVEIIQERIDHVTKVAGTGVA